MALLLLALGLTVVMLLYRMLWPDPLRDAGNRIPGPRAYPVVGSIFNFRLSGTMAIKDWGDAVKKYGHTFRLWNGSNLFVIVNEPEDVQMILSSQTLLTKSVIYSNFTRWLGSGLITSSGKLWQKRRKAITPAFHFQVLEAFLETFNKCARTMVDCLRHHVDSTAFQFADYANNCALDIIAETAMGIEVKAQTNPMDTYPNAINRMKKLVGDKICNPFLLMEPFYTISGLRKMESELSETIFNFPLDVIKKKTMENNAKSAGSVSLDVFGVKKRTAFLEMLLKMKENNVPAFQTDQDIKDEVVTFMFAGHDTTASTAAFTIWLLGLHPEIQEELYQEVSNILEGEDPSIADYQKMKYLDRVIKETLRIYPIVPNISRLVTQDIVLPASGYLVPAGAMLTINIYTLHRRADLFPEPEKFDPDRFLLPQKHPFAYIPFSAGSRNCIGQKFAALELKVMISNLIVNYKIKTESKIELSKDLLLRCLNEPKISLTLRK